MSQFFHPLTFFATAHMSGRNIWINFEVRQRFILYINSWKKCTYLMQFLKYMAELFFEAVEAEGQLRLNFHRIHKRMAVYLFNF